jgi:CDI immunity proteins
MGQTLEQLENEIWGEPEYHSHLVLTCHSLHKKPIDQFTAADLRIMIGQNFGTKYLMPQALNILKSEPLIASELYEGDLLSSLVTLPKEYWNEHPEHVSQAREIASNAIKLMKEQEDIDSVDEKLIERAEQFLAKTSV